MKAFLRKREHSWLNQVSHWSNVVGLTGLRGTGKSTLIRHWCFLNQKKIKVVQFTRFSPFSEVLGVPNEPHELALESFFQHLTQTDIIIWEDLHNLAPKLQATLIPFLKSQVTSTLHVLISDESLEEFKMDIPILNVHPLQREELSLYLTEFLGIEETVDLDLLLGKTGGFPIYLNMWSQSQITDHGNKAGSGSSLLSELSDQALKLVQLISIFPQGYPYGKCSLIDVNQILDLEKKLYIITQNQKCFVQPSLFEMVRASISNSQITTLSEIAISELIRTGSNDSLSIFILALQSKSKSRILDTVMSVEPKAFEGLPTNDLKLFELLLNEINFFGATDLFDGRIARLFRINLHIRILSGDRNSALEMSLAILQKLPDYGLWEIEIFSLIYDIIHWNHRSGKFQDVEKVLGLASNLASGELKFLFRLEQAFCFVEKDPARSLQTLDQLVKSIEALPKVASQVWFQKGRAHFFLREFEKSAQAYRHAGNLYKNLDQTYFYLITQMNLLWTYLELKDFSSYESVQKTILDLSQKFGHKYIRAGCLLASAQVDRTEMQFGKALEKVLEAEKLLPMNAPPKARQDLIFEKILVLSHLGLIDEAEKHALLIENKELKLKAQLIANLVESSVDEILDLWTFEKNDYYFALTLQVGNTLSTAELQSLNQSRIGKWSILEAALVKSLKASDTDHVWILIGQLENLIVNIGEMSCERIALGLLQAQLSAGSDRTKWLSRVEIELQRWGCDTRFKNPFLAWFTSISTSSKITELTEWKQSRPNDQERWSRWVQSAAVKTSGNYVLKTLEKTIEIVEIGSDEMTKLKKIHNVVLFEELGQVYVKAKEIKEFHRKSVLRQILALLLESHPLQVSKSQLSLTVWGESYSSEIHDSRIYTSIQRLRDLISDKSIVAWDGGYKWNPAVSFSFIKSRGTTGASQHKVQTLIIQALQNFKKSGRLWASRSDLLQVTGTSESTLKREISKLMLQEIVVRKGSGPATVYSIR